MKANPGGQLASAEVIGREDLISRIWRTLERQSVVLSAERRIGKTSILRKMEAEADSEKMIIFFSDLEGIYTPLELVENILQRIEQHLSIKQKAANKFRELYRHLAGAEIGGVLKLPLAVSSHWKELLMQGIQDLMEQEERPVYFFWDEVPLMLYNIKNREDENVAMEILDVLRFLRQSHQRLRMIFTGSIGLHNVLTKLRQAKYANVPTNDMDTIEVPPLGDGDGFRLTNMLLAGEKLKVVEPVEVSRTIVREVDGFPYFIHHVVDEMARRGGEITSEIVTQVVAEALTDAQDRWHLRWYIERIATYYEKNEQQIALVLLDALALAEDGKGHAVDELLNFVKHKINIEDAETIREILNRLGKDHYVVQSGAGDFSFRFPLIKRYWRLHRGLK